MNIMQNNEEIKALNALRALAALIVLVSHYSNLSKLFGGLLGAGAGQLGVMLFFILSGFLMAYLYSNRPLSRLHFYRYFTARVARVVPLFLFVVLASYGLQKAGVTWLYDINSAESLLSHLLFINGISVLWTIPVEIQYYIIFVSLWFLSSIMNNRLSFCFILVAISFAFCLFSVPAYVFMDQLINVDIVKALPYFLVGSAFGIAYSNLSSRISKNYQSNLWLLAFVILIFLYPKINTHFITGGIELWSNILVLVLMSLFFFTQVFLVPKNSRVYANSVFDYLGKISYSVYLWHLPILYAMKIVAREHKLLAFPLYLLLVLLISTLSYYLIENPARQFIKNKSFAYKKIFNR